MRDKITSRRFKTHEKVMVLRLFGSRKDGKGAIGRERKKESKRTHHLV